MTGDTMLSSAVSQGRLAVVAAVLLQAVGKVAFGTWLVAVPSPVFVFASFLMTAVFFLARSGRGVGARAWGPLLLLNASTALTFLCFYFALKLIEPAIVGAVEIGVGPPTAMLLAWLITRERPSRQRMAVCLGIMAGCIVLGFAAWRGSGMAQNGSNALGGTDVWLGLAASLAAGIGAVLITLASKSLIGKGWQLGAVLAHRFYLILPLSWVMSWQSDLPPIDGAATLVLAVVLVSVVGVLIPLYLLQVGIGRCDAYTVAVTMAALPVFTFVFEGLSPAYHWSWPTALGLVMISGALVTDVMLARRSS